MPLRVHCPSGHVLMVPDSRAGKNVKCPRCKEVFLAPASATRFEGTKPAERARDAALAEMELTPPVKETSPVKGAPPVPVVTTAEPPKVVPKPAAQKPVTKSQQPAEQPQRREELEADGAVAIATKPAPPVAKPKEVKKPEPAAEAPRPALKPLPGTVAPPKEPNRQQVLDAKPAAATITAPPMVKQEAAPAKVEAPPAIVPPPPPKLEPPPAPVIPPPPLPEIQFIPPAPAAEPPPPPATVAPPPAEPTLAAPPLPAETPPTVEIIPPAAQVMGAYQLAAVLIAAAFLSLGPACWETWDYLQAPDLPLDTWAFVVFALGFVQIAYAVFLIQIPDWTSAWVVSLMSLALAFGYGILLGIAVTSAQESSLIRTLQLEHEMTGQRVTLWAIAMICTTSLLAWYAGHCSSVWHKKESFIRQAGLALE